MKVEDIDVSIIIINFNTDELTLRAVESVLEYSKNLKIEIIVVDNNSKHTDLECLLDSYDTVKFVKLETNIGFGKGNNYGYGLSNGKYIFLLNSDAYLINKNTLLTLMEYLKNHEDIGVVGGDLITRELKPNICHGKFLSVERILWDYKLIKRSQQYFIDNLATARHCCFNIPTAVDHLTGAAIMIKRELIEKYGLFDPRYFMYLEDMELCYRYKKHGYLSVILPHVQIVHIGGQSGVNNSQNNIFLNKQIKYSKYLFIQNITNWPTAFLLFKLGKVIPILTKIRRKLKSIKND